MAIGFIILTIALGAVAGAAQAKITMLNNDKTNLQSLYDHLKTTDAQNNQTITALNAKVSTLEVELQANYTQVQTLNGQITILNGEITTDNTLIAHLQTELQANYTNVQALTAQITQLQTKIAADQQTIAMLQATIASDQTTITQLQNELASLPRYTNLSGFVTINPGTCAASGFLPTCTPIGLYWTKILGSSIVYSDNSYQVYLPSDTTFTVTGIAYLSTNFFGATSFNLCTGTPSAITTPSGTSAMFQNFSC